MTNKRMVAYWEKAIRRARSVKDLDDERAGVERELLHERHASRWASLRKRIRLLEQQIETLRAWGWR